jgi:hypothetical protein
VLKFVDGVKALLDLDSEAPASCSVETHEAVRRVMSEYGAKLSMVLVTTASHDLSPEVRRPLDELLAILNDVPDAEPIAEVRMLPQGTVFETLATEAREAVTLEVQLLDWGRSIDPRMAYYGRVSALEVARWFEEHGADLFAENLRVVLPRSEINDGIHETVTADPENFWYYNNGVTVLAADIQRPMQGALQRDAGTFQLTDASIINGAQTVSTLGRALAEGHDGSLARAHVPVRCIEIPEAQGPVARRITRFANTQNVVTTQDFVFLDDEQHRLRKELHVLGYEYLLRAGEVPVTDDEDKVIPVREAAIALACAAADPGPAVIAKREVSRLFSRDAGPYTRLFNATTDPMMLIRSVDIVRRVNRALERIQRASDGVRAGVAVHGRTVVAHLIVRNLGHAALKDPDGDWNDMTKNIQARCDDYVNRMTAKFPANSYPGNVFKNRKRVDELLVNAELPD